MYSPHDLVSLVMITTCNDRFGFRVRWSLYERSWLHFFKIKLNFYFPLVLIFCEEVYLLFVFNVIWFIVVCMGWTPWGVTGTGGRYRYCPCLIQKPKESLVKTVPKWQNITRQDMTIYCDRVPTQSKNNDSICLYFSFFLKFMIPLGLESAVCKQFRYSVLFSSLKLLKIILYLESSVFGVLCSFWLSYQRIADAHSLT